MSVVAATIARLAAEVAELGGRVEGAAELADLIARKILPTVTPHAYVVQLGLDADPNMFATGVVQQRITEHVGVILVYRHSGDRTGEHSRAGAEAVTDAIASALVGWVPEAEADPFELRRVRLVGMREGALFVQADFATRSYLRQTEVGP